MQGPTLARKFLLRVLPVVALSILVVGMANYFVARGQISQSIDKEVRMLAQQVAASVQTFLDQRQRDLETLAETPLLKDYHTNLQYGLHREAQIYQTEIQHYFRHFSKRTNVYDLVAYYDANGVLVAGVAEHQVIDNDAPPPALPVDLADVVRQDTYRSSVIARGDRKQMVVARAVNRDDQTFCGTLLLVCNLDQLEDILQRTQIGEQGRAYLTDSSSEAVVGHQPISGADLRHRVPLAQLPWEVVVEARAEEFIGPLKRLRNLTLLFSCAVAVLVSTMLVAGIRWAMRPLSKVTEGTRRLAQGDLDHRLPMPEIRDLKPLALSFNDMADKLKERDQQVQARIRELSALRMMENSSMQKLNQESLLRNCLRAVADGMEFDRVGLYWIDRERGVIVGQYSHERAPCHFSESMFQEQQVKLGEDEILNRVVNSRQPLLIDDPHHTPGVYEDWVRKTGTSQFVLAPLCGKDDVFGIIVADNCVSGVPLTERHCDSLLLFASTAGLALENALLIERITESEARHRTILDNSPIAILGVSRDHRIRTWNRGAETIFGYASEQILGQPLQALVAPHAAPQLQAMFEQLIKKGTVHGYQLKGKAHDGKELDLSLFAGGEDKQNFLANDEWTIVINDITESRRLQEQLIKSEKLSAVGQLIAGVAHELNNPLQAVVGYSELLAEKAERYHQDQRADDEELQHVLDNAVRCRKIVDNLLLFVRHSDIRQASVCLQDAVDGALKLLHHKFKRTPAVEIITELPEQRLYVTGNFQQLEQVLINLLTNAYDVLMNWDGPQSICVRAFTVGDRVRLEVCDTGPGVPEENKEQLFEPLYTTKPPGQGTGLGLSLCRRIIAEHEGALDVFNAETGGATFYFELPLAAAPAAPATAAPSDDEPVESGQVLLLEDESAVRSLLTDLLEARGHHVRTAENLAQARELAASHDFSLVVSDIHLPDGTGLEFFQGWGRHSTRPRPRFLFLTGDIVSDQMQQLCQDNGARVLQKPVNLREFRAAVQGLMTTSTVASSS